MSKRKERQLGRTMFHPNEDEYLGRKRDFSQPWCLDKFTSRWTASCSYLLHEWYLNLASGFSEHDCVGWRWAVFFSFFLFFEKKQGICVCTESDLTSTGQFFFIGRLQRCHLERYLKLCTVFFRRTMKHLGWTFFLVPWSQKDHITVVGLTVKNRCFNQTEITFGHLCQTIEMQKSKRECKNWYSKIWLNSPKLQREIFELVPFCVSRTQGKRRTFALLIPQEHIKSVEVWVQKLFQINRNYIWSPLSHFWDAEEQIRVQKLPFQNLTKFTLFAKGLDIYWRKIFEKVWWWAWIQSKA